MAQSESLTNLQQELLKVFSLNLSESELIDIKSLIAGYFAEKAINMADKAWEEKGWTAADAERMAFTKLRKSKNTDSGN